MDLQYLIPKIRAVLTAPGVDLKTISAKRVRKQLVAGGESGELLRQQKAEVDNIIARVYESVSREAGSSTEVGDVDDAGGNDDGAVKPSPSPQKRKRSTSPDLPPNAIPSSQPQPLASKKKKPDAGGRVNHLAKDAELARKLSMELNARNTRAKASGTNSLGPSGTKKAKRSKPTLSDDDDDDDYAKPKGKAKGGLSKPLILSDELADVVGAPELSRTQAVKYLWDYIKANDLQNPTDKREILCDEKLKAVFHTEKLNMFKMNKLLGKHLRTAEE